MIVTTTNSIEGREISRYNEQIAANVVVDTTIFSDIGVSYVDFFGGNQTILIFSFNTKITFLNK